MGIARKPEWICVHACEFEQGSDGELAAWDGQGRSRIGMSVLYECAKVWCP
jgi:hypothetical protein